MKKIVKIISNCLVCFLSIFLLCLIIINFSSNKEGFMKVGKYSLFYVEGNSMYPEIRDGDFIAVNTEVKSKYNEGDIISFYYEINEGYIIITHKVVRVEENGYSYKYITEGINNDEIDEKVVLSEQIIGEYSNFRIPLLGHLVEFGRNTIGYLILVVTPLGLVLLFSIYELIKEIDKSKKGEI